MRRVGTAAGGWKRACKSELEIFRHQSATDSTCRLDVKKKKGTLPSSVGAALHLLKNVDERGPSES